MSDLVSVVMPSYNATAWLAEAIDSVLTQDYPSIELWVMDGGSTDGTVEWLSAAAIRDKRLRWRSEPDRGAAEAVNKGLREARGTVIGWLNADDRYAPGAIARAVERLKGPGEPMLVYGEGLQIDGEGKVLATYPTRPPPVGLEDFLDGCFICQPTVFFRRSLTVTLGLLDESLRTAFDFEYWLRFFRGQSARIGFLNTCQAFSRCHPAALSARLRATVAVEALTILRRHVGRAPLHWALTHLLELNENPPVEQAALERLSSLFEPLLCETDVIEFRRVLARLFLNKTPTETGKAHAGGNMNKELTRAALLLSTGESFLRDAYLYALYRPVDPDGLRSHLERLASGETTESILRSLEESPEGRRVSLRRSCLKRIRG